MNYRSSGKLFLIFLLGCTVSKAQSPWTLQQCIDYALEHNLQVKQSDLTMQSSKTQVDQSIAGFFPSLNGSASHNYYYGRSIDPYTNAYANQQVQSNSFGLSSSISIFEGLQLQNTLKQSRLSYLGSQYDLKKIRNDIALNVVTAYLQVVYTREIFSFTTDLVGASRIQRDKIKRMMELGSVSKGNLLEMESQLAADETRLAQAQSSADQAMLTLTQLLELDSTKNFTVESPVVSVPPVNADMMNADIIYAAALTNQPDIKAAEYKLEAAKKGLSISRGALYPRLFASGNLSTSYSTSSKEVTSYNIGIPSTSFSGFTSGGDSVYSIVPNVTPNLEQTPFRDQLDNNLGKSVGFTLQVPLFNGWATRSSIKRSKINLEQSRLGYEMTKKNLFKSVQQAVLDAMSAYRQHEATQKSVAAMEEAFAYSQQKYDLGLISSYDYLQAKNNLAKAKADLLQAKFDYIFRLKILDFYQGKPLTF
ncbi:MAG TPA: TolC family protein [Bacteroidia bacterium]|nr:TolC family protein [Bacteroidia bacterium]